MLNLRNNRMITKFSEFLDRVSEFIAARKGLLPLLGILLVVINFLGRIFYLGWLSDTDAFLHLGIIIATLGFMLGWAL